MNYFGFLRFYSCLHLDARIPSPCFYAVKYIYNFSSCLCPKYSFICSKQDVSEWLTIHTLFFNFPHIRYMAYKEGKTYFIHPFLYPSRLSHASHCVVNLFGAQFKSGKILSYSKWNQPSYFVVGKHLYLVV